MDNRIIFATRNNGKINEIKHIFNDSGYEIVSLDDIGFADEIVEDGSTFEENAMIKASTVMKKTRCMVLADDSGLEVDYLNKEPGVYSARYLGENVPQSDKNKYIIQKLKGVEKSLRTARFVCCIAFATPDKEPFTVRGTVEGIINEEEKGKSGFGYDPIFFVEEFEKTMAELTMDEKNSISHRGKALKAMENRLMKDGILNGRDK